jgi:hypothetical protein
VGCSLRAQQHEFGAKDVYGHIAGASLLNWPLTLAELEPYSDKAEDKMGVTGTHGIPLLDADNNQIVMTAGAKRLVTRSIPQTTWPSIRARATGVQRRLISQHTQLVQSRRSGL